MRASSASGGRQLAARAGAAAPIEVNVDPANMAAGDGFPRGSHWQVCRPALGQRIVPVTILSQLRLSAHGWPLDSEAFRDAMRCLVP